MPTLAKNISFQETNPITIYTGLGINEINTGVTRENDYVNIQKLILNTLMLSTEGSCTLDIYAQATDRKNNKLITFDIIKNLNIHRGALFSVLPEKLNFTTEYSIFIKSVKDVNSKSTPTINVYFEYAIASDSGFVNSYYTLNHS